MWHRVLAGLLLACSALMPLGAQTQTPTELAKALQTLVTWGQFRGQAVLVLTFRIDGLVPEPLAELRWNIGLGTGEKGIARAVCG